LPGQRRPWAPLSPTPPIRLARSPGS
jgi:hypothetical protein